MSSEPMLFINKGLTSKTLSRSDGKERSRIFSHVQRPSQGRLPDLCLLPPNTSTALDRKLHDAREADLIKDKDSSTSSESTKLPRRRSKGFNPPNGSLLSRSPSPLIAVSIAQLDLWGAPAKPISDYMNTVLEFYAGAVMKRIYPSKLLADESRQHTLSYAAHDAVALNAILCTSSGALYMHYGDAKHAYHSCYFKAQAIHSLKQVLSCKDTPGISLSTLYAVSLLLWVECLQGDMTAVEAHIRGLDRMITLVHTFPDSPLPVLATIVSSYYYCVAMLGTRPLLEPPASAPEQKLSAATSKALKLLNEDSDERLGARFFKSSNAAVIGSTLLEVVSAQRDFILFKQHCASGRLDATYDEIQNIYNRDMRADYLLLNIPFDASETHFTSMQNAVRLALYVHAKPMTTVAKPSAAFSRCMTKQLKDALERTSMYDLWAPNSDLLLWVLFVAAQISYDQPEWPWIVSNVAMVVESLHLESLNEVREILMEFYYCSEVFGETLKRVWKGVMSILQRVDT